MSIVISSEEPLLNCGLLLQPMSGANMGEVVRFVSKSERERVRLIREARATYDSIFPPTDALREPHDQAPASPAVSGADALRRVGSLTS